MSTKFNYFCPNANKECKFSSCLSHRGFLVFELEGEEEENPPVFACCKDPDEPVEKKGVLGHGGYTKIMGLPSDQKKSYFKERAHNHFLQKIRPDINEIRKDHYK